MNVMETLLGRRWIVRSEDRELYYRVKDQAGTVKRFLSEKLGYQLIVNQYLIKLEKSPAAAERWMGITEFTDVIEYIFLCMILMFLEDKEAEEQFVLSELTEYIQSNYREETIDWTRYSYRRHLIRVMKYCVKHAILKVDDGSEEGFAADDASEVLYENTGTSKYFMRNFTRNIMDFTKTEDFGESGWIDVNEDRGIVRRQRVYRKLLMSTGMYKEDEGDEDFAYVKNYRNMIAGELQEYFDCELHVHKNCAFLVLGEDCQLGKGFPEENTLSDIILLCNRMFREAVEKGEIPLNADESAWVSHEQFRGIVEECKARYGKGFVKLYREMTTGEFYGRVRDYMELMEFIRISPDGDQILLRPVVGLLTGRYPEDFDGREKETRDEQQMEGV